jgi:hypothetical protein
MLFYVQMSDNRAQLALLSAYIHEENSMCQVRTHSPFFYFSYNLDLPVECDDEYMENADPSLAFKQPPGKPSRIAYFNAHINLLLILGSAQRTIVSNVFESKLGHQETCCN